MIIPQRLFDLDDVPVPVENRIGKEGEGWRVMTSGLNFERIIVAASLLGAFHTAVVRLSIRTEADPVCRPTLDLLNNQFKVADLIMKLKLSRLATYYAAYMFDLDQDSSVASSICKSQYGYIHRSHVRGNSSHGRRRGDEVYPLRGFSEKRKPIRSQVAPASGKTRHLSTRAQTDGKRPRMAYRIVHPELGFPYRESLRSRFISMKRSS